VKFYKQLDRVEQRYRILKLEVEALRKTVKTLHQQPPPLIITNAEAIILNLPAHLQKTYITLQQLGRCEAQQAADKTGKARALESRCPPSLRERGLKAGTLGAAKHGRPRLNICLKI